MIIINADDFGGSREINEAIIESFKTGICSSTTIMSNMDAFEHALEGAHENGIENIGIHLVLTQGIPLTEGIKGERRFCDHEGRFCFERNKHFTYNAIQKKLLYDEFEAQIKRCIDHGIKLTHIDSHHHVHVELGIAKIIHVLAKENKISAIRLSRNIGEINPIKRVYKNIHNSFVQKRYMNTTKYFGNLASIEYELNRGNSKVLDSCEIMIHPLFNDKGEIVDLDNRVIKDVINNINNMREIKNIEGYKNSYLYKG